jgi:caffeoyl-CoA O-methyltransferase
VTELPPELSALADRFTTPAEHELEQLEAETREMSDRAQMLSGAVNGRLLETLVFVAQPKMILEIGTFTGYGALSMARALPPDGRLITLESDPEHAAFARRHVDRHGRIAVREGPALKSIAALDGPFDLVFIDADKDAYIDYYEAVLPKLSPRGLIVADNTLFASVMPFNEHVAADPRTVQVFLTIREGVTVIRRA